MTSGPGHGPDYYVTTDSVSGTETPGVLHGPVGSLGYTILGHSPGSLFPDSLVFPSTLSRTNDQTHLSLCALVLSLSGWVTGDKFYGP